MSVDPAPDQAEMNRLLQRVGHHDRQAFAELYRRSSPRLYGVCLRMLRDPREAEDILQEAYVTIWHRGGTFDPSRSGAMTWMVSLTRNKAIDQLRRHTNVTTDADFPIETLAEDAPSPAARAELHEDRRRLETCLDELETQHRHAIREAFFSGNTYQELARRAQVPLGTMKSWIRRGLLQLRACLET